MQKQFFIQAELGEGSRMLADDSELCASLEKVLTSFFTIWARGQATPRLTVANVSDLDVVLTPRG